jgi:hypothetical protein
MIGADTTFLVQLELIELPAHKAAHELLQCQILQPQVPLALAPQVLAEFIHVFTDPRRFQKPLTADEALTKARFWWTPPGCNTFSDQRITVLFLDFAAPSPWSQTHLDTQLAAILVAGARHIPRAILPTFKSLVQLLALTDTGLPAATGLSDQTHLGFLRTTALEPVKRTEFRQCVGDRDGTPLDGATTVRRTCRDRARLSRY